MQDMPPPTDRPPKDRHINLFTGAERSLWHLKTLQRLAWDIKAVAARHGARACTPLRHSSPTETESASFRPNAAAG